MSNSCTGSDCSNKLAEYKNGIDKLLKRLRDSDYQKSQYEIQNLTLKQKLNRPSKIESKHFQRIFNLIQILIDRYFGKSKREDSIRDIFLAMIDSIWSLLATRYTDNDSWLDLKYLGTNIVEALANLELPPFVQSDMPPNNLSDDHIYETLANLKKGEEFQHEKQSNINKINIIELNKEVDFLKKQTTMMREKILEQNCIIKTMCKSFSKKLQAEKLEQQQLNQLNTSNNTTTNTTTSSSVRLSSCSNEVSSSSFNLNSSQVYSSSSEKNHTDIGRVPLPRSPLSIGKESSLTCPSRKILVDARRYSVDKFDKHGAICKNTCANDNPNNDPNNICLNLRRSSGSSSVSSNNSAGSATGSNNNNNNNSYQSQLRASREILIEKFEPKPRKRL